MKIAIFTSYGKNKVPMPVMKLVQERMANTKNHYRIILADELIKLPANCDVYNQENYNEFTRNCDMDYLKVKNSDYLYCKGDGFDNYSSTIKIIDVDTSKNWRISEYDGAESLEYFGGVTVINEFNESKW